MAIDFRIDQLRFSGSENAVSVGESDLIVLIGPNNAGKSAGLREMQQHVREAFDGVVIKGLTTVKRGDEDEFVAWLLEVASRMPPGREDQVVGWKAEMPFVNAKARWQEENGKAANLTDFLVLLVNAETRLRLAGSVTASTLGSTFRASHSSDCWLIPVQSDVSPLALRLHTAVLFRLIARADQPSIFS